MSWVSDLSFAKHPMEKMMKNISSSLPPLSLPRAKGRKTVAHKGKKVAEKKIEKVAVGTMVKYMEKMDPPPPAILEEPVKLLDSSDGERLIFAKKAGGSGKAKWDERKEHKR